MRRAFLHTALLVAACGGGGPAATAPATPEAPANAGSIAGTVRDASSGDPLSMAEIEVIEWTTKERATELASSQADGSYRIDGLPPGTYLIDVRYADYRLRLFAVPVEANQTTALDLPLDTTALSSDSSYDYVDMATNPVLTKPPPDPTRTATHARRSGGIRGVVRDIARSEALPGAVISALTGPTGRTRNAISDDDGRYLLRGLPPGTYTLSVYYHLVDRGNIEVRRTGVEVVAGEITEIDLNIDAKTEE